MFYFRHLSGKQNMDAIKAELEFEPMHGLTLNSMFDEQIQRLPLCLQDDNRHEVYVDATYKSNCQNEPVR
jgi:hypothetical protein